MSQQLRCASRVSVRLLLALILAVSCPPGWALDWRVGSGQWTSSLGLRANLANSSSSSATSSAGSTSYSLQESFSVNGSGLYLIDPRLVKASMGFTLSLNQYRADSAGASSASDSLMTGYNFNASMLEYKPYPIELFASRTQIDDNLDFGRSRTGSFESRGFRVRLLEDSELKKWLGPWFSAKLDAREEHRQQTTTFFDRVSYFDQTRRTVNAEAHKGFTTADLWLRYRGADQSSAGQTQVGARSQVASVDYSLDFGPGLNRTLNSSLAYATRNALLASNTLHLTENLHINHYRNLSTDYDYEFNRDEAEGAVALDHIGRFSVAHQLYKNLNTNLELSGERNEIFAGTLTRYGGSLSQNYNHSLPRGGSLGLNWSGNYERSSSALSVGRLSAKEQFNAAEPTAAEPTQKLSKPFIIESSIRVFNLRDDPEELELVQDRDYTVEVIRDFTYITPIYPDTLPNNDPVEPGDLLRVTYDYEVDPNLEVQKDGAGYGASVSYGWIGGAYSHRKTTSTLLRGASRFAENNARDEIVDSYGVNLNFGWIGASYSHTQTQNLLVSSADRLLSNDTLVFENSRDDAVKVYMSVSGSLLGLATAANASHLRSNTRSNTRRFELDLQEDTSKLDLRGSGRLFGMDATGSANFVRYRGTLVKGYDRSRVLASLHWKPRERWRVNFSASAVNTHHLDPERQFSLFTARTSLNWQTASGWRNRVRAEVRTEQNDLSPRSLLMQLEAGTQFEIGKLSLGAGLSVAQSTVGSTRQNRQSLNVNLRRTF